MASFTLAQMRTKVRERADMQNSTFISDTELDGYINSSYAELYDLIIDKHGEDYYISSQNYTSSAGQTTFSLPADFYKLRGVDLNIGSNSITLKKFEFAERNRFNNLVVYADGECRYRLRGSNLILTPALGTSRQLTLWYIPKPATLVSGSDAIDGINGFEEYVVVDAAIKCRSKEESDIQDLVYMKQSLLMRIEKMADARDANEPSRIVDTEISRESTFQFR